MSERLKFGLAGAWVLVLLVLLFNQAKDTSFSTSVVDLLPGNDPEVRILRELVENEQGRQLTVRLHAGGGAVQPAAVKAFIAGIDDAPAISRSWISGSKALEAAGAVIFENRYRWLLPEWLDRNFPDWRSDNSITAEALARRVVERMDTALLSPEGFALTETIPRDPFLLAGYLYESGGLLPPVSNSLDAYIWVQQAASPFIEAGQGPVFQALEDALAQAAEVQPGIQMEYSGVSVFASASKAGIKAEIQRLNLFGLIFVLLVSILALQRFLTILRVAIVLLVSLLTAATAVITVFPAVHIIALVIGSILGGIAVDYAFHLLLVENHGLPQRSVTKAVVTGSVSSALGFIVLLWAPLPFLQQVGVFVGAGLIAALLISLLLRPQSTPQPLPPGWRIRPFCLPRWTGPACLLLALPGLLHMDWKDSINDLEYPLPELKQADERLQQQSSVTGGRKLYLAVGSDPAEARAVLAGAAASSDEYIHAGKWIPVYADSLQAQRLFAGLPGFESALRAELERRDYLADSFAGFFSDWARYLQQPVTQEQYDSDMAGLSESLPGPMRNFIHSGGAMAWFMIMVPEDVSPDKFPGLIELDPASMLSRSFSNYREAILAFAGICLLGILICIILVYGLTGGLLSLGLPFGALLIAFGISGWLHSGLGLFHLVGGLLSFCIGLDYAIFAVQTHRQKCPLPASVTISLITTLGVFGILSTSRIPGVHQFALTVLLGIGFAALLIVCAWPSMKHTPSRAETLFARLPHGAEALMILRTRNLEKGSIEMECRPDAYQAVPGECLVEAMAQSAAVWLAASAQSAENGRTGLLILVQECELLQPVLEAGACCIARVELVSGADEGLLVFKGSCVRESGDLLIQAQFSIFIPPVSGETRDS